MRVGLGLDGIGTGWSGKPVVSWGETSHKPTNGVSKWNPTQQRQLGGGDDEDDDDVTVVVR